MNKLEDEDTVSFYVKVFNGSMEVLAATPHKTPTVRPPAPYHENYSS